MCLLTSKEFSFLSRWILWFAHLMMLSVLLLNFNCDHNAQVLVGLYY